MAQALEASSRVDTEMVAGAVKGALVDVCVKRDTHAQKNSSNYEKVAHFPRCPLLYFLFAVTGCG